MYLRFLRKDDIQIVYNNVPIIKMQNMVMLYIISTIPNTKKLSNVKRIFKVWLVRKDCTRV